MNGGYEICRSCGREVYIPEGRNQGVCDRCGSVIYRIRSSSAESKGNSAAKQRMNPYQMQGTSPGDRYWDEPMKRNRPGRLWLPIVAVAVMILALVAAVLMRFRPTSEKEDTADMPLPQVQERAQPTAAPQPRATRQPTTAPQPTPIPAAPIVSKEISYSLSLGQPSLPQLVPAGASASSALFANGHDYPATAVIDSNHKNSWQEGVPGDGIGQNITVLLNGNQWLSAVSFRIGYAANAQWYYNNNRPKDVRVYFSDGRSVDLCFSDTREYQTICFDEPVNTSLITMEILSVYYGSMHDRMQDTCMSEIVAYGQ